MFGLKDGFDGVNLSGFERK